ncbi:MAG: class I SAM-dependent methyltransferase [Leptolyngbyaceae cyanobacterium CRU_2_3]|nr:class I SAM-dependent methyltransferase [Leptolyngbyaceae cyanobacterium CRU_2_3]
MTQDPYDIAYEWGWSNSELHDLVYLCYKTPNLAENARRYYQSEEFQAVVAILSDLGKKPEAGVHVLDFGCGNGIASYALSLRGYTVTGVDSSLGEIAGLNAARKIQNLDNSNFSLIHSTGENLDFSDESFDVVWIREALHHIKHLDEFLLEIRRVLKPNGILCCLRDVVIWNEYQRQFFFETHPFHPITQDEGCYYLEEYVNAFKRVGLLIEKLSILMIQSSIHIPIQLILRLFLTSIRQGQV